MTFNRFNITIAPSPHGSDDSSLSDEEGSSGVQVSPPSEAESHGYHDPYDEWSHLPYPDEIKPSDSASRPRTTYRPRSRNPVHPPSSSASRRHSSRRHAMPERESFPRRSRRRPSPESPESMDSGEEDVDPYHRTSQERKIWPPVTQSARYAHSPSPGPSYVYSNGAVPHGQFVAPNGPHAPSDQLVRVGPQSQIGHPNQFGHSGYPYNHMLQQQPHGALPPYYLHERHAGAHPHLGPTNSHRNDAHNLNQHPFPHHIPPHGAPPYGAPQLNHHDLIPYGAQGGYYPFGEPYTMVPGMIHPSYFNPYHRPPSPSQAESAGSPVPAPAPAPAPAAPAPPPEPTPAPAPAPPPPPAENVKDEAIARLEKLILEERTEREARESREAARQAALEREAAEQAAREERAAHEKKIVEEAAANAKAEAEQKAAEEAAKAKKEAEEAAEKAVAEAAAAATEAAKAEAADALAAATAAANKPPEKKKPIKFKDALGRKFSFPFDLCCTWQGMEELIKQAFLHIEVIGPHVAEGHYDLIGPNGDIILPQVWETVIEPDWTITMHMWPIPEKPKTPEPAPADGGGAEAAPAPDAAAPSADAATAEEPKKKAETGGAKKPRAKPGDPGAFAMWMVGAPNRFRSNKALKVGKKPKVVHHGALFRIM